jgi:acetylornithine deacetylase
VADVERDITELLADCSDVKTSSRTTLAREPFETDDDSAIVAEVAKAATEVSGKPAELVGVSYWADSAFIAAAGIPTVLFGPNGDGAHAEVEWVSLAGTVECTRTLIATARSFCR